MRVRDGLSGSYRLRHFESLLGKWQDRSPVGADEITAGYVLQIERKGFSLLELTQET